MRVLLENRSYKIILLLVSLQIFTSNTAYSQNILQNSGFEDFPTPRFGNTFPHPFNPWILVPGAARVNIVKMDGPGGFDYGDSGPESDAAAPGAGIEQHYYDGTGGNGHAYQVFTTLDCGSAYTGNLTYMISGFFSSRESQPAFGEVTLVEGVGIGGTQVVGPDLSANVPNTQTWQQVLGDFNLTQGTTYSYVTFFDDFGNFDEASVSTPGCPTSIDLTKTASASAVSNANETITYDIVVSNTGTQVATDIVITDSLAAAVCPSSGTNTISVLVVAATETCIATYTVLQSDFDTRGGGNDQINNTVTLTANSMGGFLTESDSEAVTLIINPSLSIQKTADRTDNVGIGETIIYEYVILNNGNLTLSNIQLTDAHNASGPPPVPANEFLSVDNGQTGDSFDTVANDGIWQRLSPGDEITFSGTYTVTQSDIDSLQ